MIRIPVNLPKEHHEYLRQQAFAEKCSMSDLIRRAVQKFVSHNGHDEEVKRIKLEMENDPNQVRLELDGKLRGGK